MSADGGIQTASFWRHPAAWVREKNFSRGYWVFFNLAFFYDTGFAIYWFLFNLYLLDYHFTDRAIGLINGSLTLGLLVGTLPVGALGRRYGPRPVLMFCFIVAPLVNVARVLWVWEPAQIALAFVAGLSMCTWTVTFLPAVSKLTTEANRTAAISLIFSIGIGCSALGAAVCGYMPHWLGDAGFALEPAAVKRCILIGACALAAVGLVPTLRLRIGPQEESPKQEGQSSRPAWLQSFRVNSFVVRFVVCMALWSVIMAAFTPFANVYLSRDLHIPLERIGVIFSVAQLLQLGSGLLVPLVMRGMGMLNGILATQLAAAITLGAMASMHHPGMAVAFYLGYSAAQWMSSPALYSLLMNETPDAERSTAASMTMFTNSLVSSGATAGAGILFTQFGYSRVLVFLAAGAAGVGFVCRALLTQSKERGNVAPAPGLDSALTHLD